MKPQKYNCPLLVRETMDTVFMSQVAMVDRLKVCQQTISLWLNGIRNPRAEILPELLKLAQETGLDIRNYETNPGLDRIKNFMKKNNSNEFRRLMELYDRMSPLNKKKLRKYSERMAG